MRISKGLVCATGWLLVAVILCAPVYAQRILPDEPSPDSGEEEGVQRLLPEEEPGPGGDGSGANRRVRVDRLLSDSAAMRRTIRSLRRRIERLRADSAAMRRRIQELERRDSRQGPRNLRSESTTGEPSGEQLSFEASPETRFNPNTASLTDLRSIPGLTERLAERIEWYRREVQPFQNRNDLRRVPGIDRRVYRSIAPYFHEGPYR